MVDDNGILPLPLPPEIDQELIHLHRHYRTRFTVTDKLSLTTGTQHTPQHIRWTISMQHDPTVTPTVMLTVTLPIQWQSVESLLAINLDLNLTIIMHAFTQCKNHFYTAPIPLLHICTRIHPLLTQQPLKP